MECCFKCCGLNMLAFLDCPGEACVVGLGGGVDGSCGKGESVGND
jgi:hypothetical protein